MTDTEAAGAAPDKDAAKKAAAEKKAADKAATAAKREQERAEKKAAKEKEKADKKAAKEAGKAASKQPEQNSIRRPKADTITGKVWDTFDAISAETGAPATISEAIKRSTGVAEATVRTQYARWRKFHGISGRAEKPAPAAAASA